nr:MAG: ORF1 [Torque teno midi virus]
MPFWWNRRRKPWFGRWRRKRRRTRYKRRRPYARRRRRRAPRRRRRYRKRGKVRRKRQKIKIQQWQPDRIVKCKIIGLGCLVAGAQGRQFQCYTDTVDEYPPPKTPGGGGFGVEVFTLQYLYQQWQARKNIWTKSNDYTDLCRYTGTKITVIRHATTDFVISYDRAPPFNLEKETYIGCHPVNLLLSKHHKVILSRKSHPTGKSSVSFTIKPPKLMQTHWFFQQEFCKRELFQLRAAACNMSYAYYGPNTQSSLLTFYSLNTNFFVRHNWAQQVEGGHGYIPYAGYPATTAVEYTYPTKTGEATYTMQPPTKYLETVNKETGFFNWRVLTATKVSAKPSTTQHETPITVARYNPLTDTGKDTYVWLVSTVANTNWQTPKDSDLVVAGYPLWMALYGLWNFIQRKKNTEYIETGLFVVKSPAIKLISKTVQTIFPLLDISFIKGEMPWDQLLTDTQKKLWYPTALKQQQIINTFIESGPYVPKYSNLPSSTWELTYKYKSYFKWGGPELTDQPVQDPCPKKEYDVSDTIKGTIQIQDPLKQKYQQLLRAWDIRRGMFTKTAIKRMYQNLQTDESVCSDETEPAQKKKKVTAQIKLPEEENQEINQALLSLCEENTCQEQDLQQLIQFQQQQQQKLKRDLINIILDLKNKQRILQLQTGIS